MFGNILTLFVTICFISYLTTTFVTSKILRVFQGRDAISGEFPYVVALVVKFYEGTQYELYEPFCTGSIVAPVWVVTAGHCVENLRTIASDILQREVHGTKLAIRYTMSSENKHDKWVTSDIISTQLHPSYKVRTIKLNQLTVINDIGLVKIKNTTVLMLGRFSPIDYRTLFGHKVISAGLGLMKSKDNVDDALSLNKSLQIYEAVVVKCLNTKDIVRPSFCLSWNCNQPATSCRGDSGGPVIHPTGIIAVLTAGDNENCNTIRTSHFAGLVTPLSPFIDWIIKRVRE